MGHNLKVLGIIIKEERKLKNLSQLDFANLFSVNQSTISRLERGELQALNLYEKVLNIFGISIVVEKQMLTILLTDLYKAIDLNQTEIVKDIYLQSLKYDKLSYEEYYIKKIIYLLFLMYTKDYDKLKNEFNKLYYLPRVISNSLLKYYYLIHGYIYYIDREYLKADDIFKKIIPMVLDDNDDFFNYIYALNNISLGRFNVAQYFIEISVKSSKNKKNILRFNQLEYLSSYLFFLNSNYSDSIVRTKLILTKIKKVDCNKDTICNTKLLLSTAYLLLKEYHLAIPYLKELEATPEFLNKNYNFLIYAYLLFCLKQTQNVLYDYYFKRFQESIYYNYEEKKAVTYAFINYKDTLKNRILSDYLTSFFNKSNQLVDIYIHLKVIFSSINDQMWKQRKYTSYKKIDDIMVKRLFRSSNNDI